MVLEGSVQHADGRVHVIAKVIDAVREAAIGAPIRAPASKRVKAAGKRGRRWPSRRSS